MLHLNVVTPRKLTKRQEELFRELGEIDGVHVSAEHKSFLDKVKDVFHACGGADGERNKLTSRERKRAVRRNPLACARGWYVGTPNAPSIAH